MYNLNLDYMIIKRFKYPNVISIAFYPNAHCKVYVVHYIHCTLYTVYIIHYTLYNVQCTLYIPVYTIYIVDNQIPLPS